MFSSTIAASTMEKDASQTLLQHREFRAEDVEGEMGGVMALEAPQRAPAGFWAHHRGMHRGS